MMMEHVHFIGIGGSGLSAIAKLLLESGYAVSGSDQFESPLTKDLSAAGAQISIGHQAENIQNADVIVRSSAIPDDNIEVKAALNAGIPVLKRSAFIGRILQNNKGIAIAGTHGKSTTTAMLTWILTALDLDPGYIIGAISKNTGKNAHAGTGPYFVIEADEYDRMFLGIEPFVEIINPIEHDHPDCYPTMADYVQAFIDFAGNLKPDGLLFINSSNTAANTLIQSLTKKQKAWTFGLESNNHYFAQNLSLNHHGCYSFDLCFKPDHSEISKMTTIHLQVPGTHNVCNAIACLAVVHQLGLNVEKAGKALAAFTGIARRFEIAGVANGITFIDDYGHHPTEIKTTLAAARSKYPDHHIIAVWQPHTYSRTMSLLTDFGSAFSDADEVIVTKVYAAREMNDSFNPQTILNAIHNSQVQYFPENRQVSDYLAANATAPAIVLVFSAGDAIEINQNILKQLTTRQLPTKENSDVSNF